MSAPDHPFKLSFAALLTLGGLLAGVSAHAAGDPWAQCGAALRSPPRPVYEGDRNDTESVQAAADQANLIKQGVSVLQGNVQILRGTGQLQADTVTYDEPAATLDAEGNVRFWDDGLYVIGSHARSNLDENTSEIDNARFLIEDAHGQGTARRAVLRGNDLVKARTGTYTTCDLDSPDWLLSASKITLNKTTNIGTGRNVWVRFKRVPIFYSPYLSFPLSDARKSGFLVPQWRFSGVAGAEFTQPYYFNLAPNRDATLGLRAMAGRGLQVQGEYRYLTQRGSGELNLEYIPNDFAENDSRGLIHFAHRGSFAPHWSASANFDWVSDPRYFEDLGTELSVSSRSFLERRADLTRTGDGWWATLRAQTFQTVDDTLPATSRPYFRIPQLQFGISRAIGNRRINTNLRGEVVYFERDASVTGARLDLRPTVSYPMRSEATFLVPSASLRYTRYDLSGTAVGADANPWRLIPTVSVDSGLFLERGLKLGGRALTQTLEPRLYYLFTPFDNQSDFPVFDTGQFTFNIEQLFRDDRFSGADRVGDANQVAISLTSRLLGEDGGELAHLSVGQIRYFRDRKITLPGVARDTSVSSDIVAEAAANIAGRWRFAADLQWDPRLDRSDKSTLSLRYRPDNRRILNLAYRFVRGTAEQTDFSFAWPIVRNWRAVGRWNYALPQKQLLEGLLGVEYESCCWGLRLLGRRYLSDSAGNHSAALFVQLQLKGLAGVGEKTLAFLRQGIPGYEREF